MEMMSTFVDHHLVVNIFSIGLGLQQRSNQIVASSGLGSILLPPLIQQFSGHGANFANSVVGLFPWEVPGEPSKDFGIEEIDHKVVHHLLPYDLMPSADPMRQ